MIDFQPPFDSANKSFPYTPMDRAMTVFTFFAWCKVYVIIRSNFGFNWSKFSIAFPCFAMFDRMSRSNTCVKKQADEKVILNNKVLNNESFFDSMLMRMVIGSFEKKKINLEPESAKYINACLVREYMNEYQGVNTW